MCLAIPAEIVEITDGVARCRVGGGDTFIKAALMILEKDLVVGDYIIVHAGFALDKLDKKEALETIHLMQEMLRLNQK